LIPNQERKEEDRGFVTNGKRNYWGEGGGGGKKKGPKRLHLVLGGEKWDWPSWGGWKGEKDEKAKHAKLKKKTGNFRVWRKDCGKNLGGNEKKKRR